MKKQIEKQKFPLNIGLALGGGAARGFCHLGVLKVFEANNIPIHCITGCSMGAVLGGCYAAGVSISDMEKIIARITDRILRDFSFLSYHDGLFKGKRAMAIIKRFIGSKTIADCVIPFAATATEIQKGEQRVLMSGSLADAIHASMSIPAIFQFVQTAAGERLVDGGVTERIPVSAARALGADFVIAVDALGSPRHNTEMRGVMDMTEQAFLLMDWAANKARILTEPDYLITPDQGNRSVHKFTDNALSVEAGAAAAEAALPEILERINEWRLGRV